MTSPLSNTAPPATPLRILLIEDNPMDAELIQRILLKDANHSFDVQKASCLADALGRLQSDDIGFVLCDLSLPDSPGPETFDKIRVKAPHLPIIVLTGHADEQLAVRLVQEGAQDYLIKNEVDERMLVRAIRYGLERKRAELALEKERDLFQTLMDNIPDRIFFKDLQGRFRRINRAQADNFHLKEPKDAVGKSDFDFFSNEHAFDAFGDEARILLTGEPLLGKVEKETFPDGHIAWVMTSKLALRDRHGRIVGTFGTSRDITKLKQTEEELKQTNTELREVQKQIQAAHLYLIEAEKMQSVGRLAAGVAHEVKNPLAILRMGVEYLVTEEGSSPERIEVINSMKTAIDRADTIIRGLLDFSASQELKLEPSSIQEVIEKSLMLVKHESDRVPVTVTYRPDPSLPRVLMDAEKIKQVLINLLTNSIQAMPKGGELEVRTYCETILPDETRSEAGSRQADRLRAGDHLVVVEVLDTGKGIPTDKLDNIFDPFFTTKPTGMGTGLGLTVSKKIVDMHGGRIDIRNRREKGVSAVLKLKVA